MEYDWNGEGVVSYIDHEMLDIAASPVWVKNDRESYIAFHDTMRPRAMEVKRVIKEEEQEFVFESQWGRIKLVPMTLSIYNASVRDKLEGSPKFKTIEELRKYFIETLPSKLYG